MLYERVVLGLSAKLAPTMLSLLALKNGTGAPAAFGTIIAEAIEKWTRVIKFAGIKVE
jgi:hypothetical protein